MAIKVLIADDVAETRDNVRRLLSLDKDVEVVGEVSNGREAVSSVSKHNPDIVLMDINMPIMDGIEATEQISFQKKECYVIIMSIQGEQEYLRKSMLAGARDYIVKPFSNDEIINTVKQVYELERRKKDGVVRKAFENEPQIITFFGTKGGIGKTTMASNVAVALRQLTNAQVALVDLDLQFGDVAAMLNIMPRQTIAELVQEAGDIDTELLESYMLTHKASGVRILSAPVKPEHAELITQAHVEQIFKILKENYQYIIVDTSSYFSDANLAAMEASNQILMVLAMDLLTVKDTKLALNIMESLNMKNKTNFVLNRSSDGVAMKKEDLEQTLDCNIWASVPTNTKQAVEAINKGIPFTISQPSSNISEGIFSLAKLMVKGGTAGKKKNRLLANFF